MIDEELVESAPAPSAEEPFLGRSPSPFDGSFIHRRATVLLGLSIMSGLLLGAGSGYLWGHRPTTRYHQMLFSGNSVTHGEWVIFLHHAEVFTRSQGRRLLLPLRVQHSSSSGSGIGRFFSLEIGETRMWPSFWIPQDPQRNIPLQLAFALPRKEITQPWLRFTPNDAPPLLIPLNISVSP